MPESLTAPARDALLAATELADLCAGQMHNEEPDDWADMVEQFRALIRRFDAGRHVLAAVLDAHRPAAPAA